MSNLARRLSGRIGRRLRTGVDLVRPLPRALSPLIDARSSSPHLVMRAAAAAHARGDRATAVAALLRLLSRGPLSASNQRLLRHLTADAAPLPPVHTPLSPVRTRLSPDCTRLSPGHAPAVLALSTQPPGGLEWLTVNGVVVADAWRPAWSTLPRALAEQLVTCALSRRAHIDGVTDVRVVAGTVDPALERIAAASAAALTATLAAERGR
jgi:hypothetical protein